MERSMIKIHTQLQKITAPQVTTSEADKKPRGTKRRNFLSCNPCMRSERTRDNPLQHVPPRFSHLPPIYHLVHHHSKQWTPASAFSIFVLSIQSQLFDLITIIAMAEIQPPHHILHPHQPQPQQPSYQAVKAATAATAGGSLLVLSGLTLVGTVIALTVATPLLVIFSPVLVPAAIAVFFLVLGFLASGGFGVAAVTVLSWIYRYVTGRHPPGADHLDSARMKLASKAREMKDRAEQFGQQHTGQQGT